jgi:hypothetical protein
MGFFKKLSDLFNTAPVKPIYNFSVRCNRCGEMLTGRIDLHNEPSLDDDGKGYHVRKVLIGRGEQHCFNQVTVELDFDLNHKLKSREISGGTFIEA